MTHTKLWACVTSVYVLYPVLMHERWLCCRCKSAYDERESWVADPAMYGQLNNLAMLIGQLFLVLEVNTCLKSSLFFR